MKIMMWFWLLTKRLYKKPTFLAILLLIPALVLGYGAAAGDDSGMITVALAQKGDDPLGAEWIAALADSSQLIRFEICPDGERAENLVRGGKADMAWIFHEDPEAGFAAFAAQPKKENAFVTVLLREDSVALRLAREKLSGMLYQALSRQVYISFVRENVPELDVLSQGELMEYYDNTLIGRELFVFEEWDTAMEDAQRVNYLTAPVRGLLAVVIVLCAMATAMYYIQDTRRGTFAWVGARALPGVELGCQLVSLVNVTAVVMLALALSGQMGNLRVELPAALLYCFCCAAFAMLLRRLWGSLGALATLLPLLVVVMLAICPVFFDLGILRSFQYLLPPTYFIQAVYNAKYLVGMAGYTILCLGAYALLGLVRE